MALTTFDMAQELRAKAKDERENRAAKIALALYENGIIDHTSQRSISGEKLRLAWEDYAWGELARQAQGKDGKRGSTGTGGKGCDSYDRLHMAYMREYSVDIVDIACRPAGLPDITVQCDEKAAAKLGKSRIQVEGKTNAGCLVTGETLDECWSIIADACERGKWIAWRFAFKPETVLQADAWDTIDDSPCIFLPINDLCCYLKQYKGEKGNLETWFKVNGETAINFQTTEGSEKKKSWLYKIYNECSYDWPTFRDWGKLIKVNKG
jgi:hypothetical protein